MVMPEPGFGPFIKMLNEFMDREANRNLKALNMTRSQCHLLMVLYRQQDHSVSLKDLEGAFQVAQPTIVGLVSRMEAKGLVSRCTDPRDKRIRLVRLTEEGRAICLRAYADIQLTEQRLTSSLSSEERTQMLSLLRRVCDSLR